MTAKLAERLRLDLATLARACRRGHLNDQQLRAVGAWAHRKGKQLERDMGLEAKVIEAYKAQVATLTASGQDLQQQLDAARQQLSAAQASAKDADDLAAEQAAAVELGLTPPATDPTGTPPADAAPAPEGTPAPDGAPVGQ